LGEEPHCMVDIVDVWGEMQVPRRGLYADGKNRQSILKARYSKNRNPQGADFLIAGSVLLPNPTRAAPVALEGSVDKRRGEGLRKEIHMAKHKAWPFSATVSPVYRTGADALRPRYTPWVHEGVIGIYRFTW
jgi:hypothetical protein